MLLSGPAGDGERNAAAPGFDGWHGMRGYTSSAPSSFSKAILALLLVLFIPATAFAAPPASSPENTFYFDPGVGGIDEISDMFYQQADQCDTIDNLTYSNFVSKEFAIFGFPIIAGEPFVLTARAYNTSGGDTVEYALCSINIFDAPDNILETWHFHSHGDGSIFISLRLPDDFRPNYNYTFNMSCGKAQQYGQFTVKTFDEPMFIVDFAGWVVTYPGHVAAMIIGIMFFVAAFYVVIRRFFG